MTGWVYKQTYGVKPDDPGAEFEVGFYSPDNVWHKVSKHVDHRQAGLEVHFLNGGDTRLQMITSAIGAYHFALDSRMNGDVAAYKAIDTIMKILKMPWRPKNG